MRERIEKQIIDDLHKEWNQLTKRVRQWKWDKQEIATAHLFWLVETLDKKREESLCKKNK